MRKHPTCRRPDWRGPRAARGLAAVEFILSVPVLLLVMFAVIEIGRALVQYDTLSYAVRDSARFVSENAIAGTTGVVDITPAVRQQAQRLVVYGNAAGAGAPCLPGLGASRVTVAAAGLHDVEVIAEYPYQPIIGAVLPTFGYGDSIPLALTMRVSVIMRAIS
jgi:Flp pilus assembly protein TadG